MRISGYFLEFYIYTHICTNSYMCAIKLVKRQAMNLKEHLRGFEENEGEML